MTYDLVMVAASKDPQLVAMTQRAIDSCLADGADVNVILVETFKKARYRGVNQIVLYEEEFCYNRCLNYGLKHAKGDIQILANNDIIFAKGWSEIGDVMRANDILSASALSDTIHHRMMKKGYYAYSGYDIGLYFTGWCIFQDRKVWEKIGSLSEQYQFWYSDNAHAEQLQRAGIAHWLICSAEVYHITSQTLAKTDRKTRHTYTYAANKRIHRNNRKNLSPQL